MLSVQEGNMLSVLTTALNTAAGRELVLGPGTFVIDAASPALPLDDYTSIRGAGRGNTILEFRNLGTSSHGLAATSKTGIRISKLTIKAATALSGNQNAVNFEKCNDCTLEDVEQINFSGGFWFTNADGPQDGVNTGNRALRCISRNSSSYGFFFSAAIAGVFDGCEAYDARAQDGFKFGYESQYLRVVNCHSEGNTRDGFDTYDGFIASLMDNCIAVGNTLHGFDVKGNFDGEHTSGDYVTRESTFTGCIARGNGDCGMSMQNVRAMNLAALTLSENAMHGLQLNGVQGLSVVGLTALRNTRHGFYLIGASRSTFSSCTAQDNSYVDGTTQNGAYDGFNLENADLCTFMGCQSFNGTQSGKLGGQRYGRYLDVASTSDVFTDFFANANVTGANN